MDLNSILPLLMGGGDKTQMISALMGGDERAQMLSAFMGGGEQKAKTADAATGMPGNQNMANIMNLLKETQKNKPARKLEGLSAISEIASADILGKLFKLLNAI